MGVRRSRDEGEDAKGTYMKNDNESESGKKSTTLS